MKTFKTQTHPHDEAKQVSAKQ